MEAVSFGRFRLVELLGRGGMAEVWKAKVDGPGGFSRTVVLKRILPGLAADPQFAKLFEREARLSSMLNHANIVQVFEFGSHANEPYLVMEYVAGLDLTRTIQFATERPLGLGPFVAREVARALRYAHTLTSDTGEPLQLVHRDISPSNVLLGLDGSVKLLDFGIAKALAEVGDRTQTGVFRGKVGYASPEATEGLAIDARADLFALGVVLYETLIGDRLFRGESDVQTLAWVREARVVPPSHRRPGIPAELDAVCLKALARNREDRFQTAADFEAALDPLVRAFDFGPTQLAAFIGSINAPKPPVPLSSLPRRPDVSATTTAPVQRRARPLVAAAAGLVVIGLATALAVNFGRTAPSSPSVPPAPEAVIDRAPVVSTRAVPTPTAVEAVIDRAPAASTPAVPTPAAVEALRPTPTTVHVESSPTGAVVTVFGSSEKLGRTPLDLSWPDHAPAKLTVSLEGFEPRGIDVAAGRPGQRFSLKLNRRTVAPAAKHRVVNVKAGEVADPFAP